jgi:hypothetical protein
MIHVVAMKRLIGLPLLIHIELLGRSRRVKNEGVGGFLYRLHGPGYNDIGLYDTSLVPSDILWYQLISRC